LARLLVIDDEKAILDLVKNGLEKDGHIVAICGSATDVAVDRLKDYDLILLDIMMPDVDGFMFCKKIRGLVDCPILFLTAKVLETDIIYGLGLGADDYITKPYNPTILLLHIEAIFKRMEHNYMNLTYENVHLILDKCLLIHNQKEYYLTKNEMLIFKYLVLHRGIIVSREDLMRYLWDSEEFVDDNTLSVNMSRLRSKLKDVGLCDVIETRKGIGYCLK